VGPPEVSYARSGEVAIAYQIVGDDEANRILDVTRADVDPHPDRRRMHRRDVLGDHTQATGQHGATYLGNVPSR
jgi:hypothetical protein